LSIFGVEKVRLLRSLFKGLHSQPLVLLKGFLVVIIQQSKDSGCARNGNRVGSRAELLLELGRILQPGKIDAGGND